MKAVSIREARQNFAERVEAARRGVPVTITRRGKKVAKLTGVGPVTGKKASRHVRISSCS